MTDRVLGMFAGPLEKARGLYTCPMHPQILREDPGTCPLCGMALEPRDVDEPGPNPELLDRSRNGS